MSDKKKSKAPAPKTLRGLEAVFFDCDGVLTDAGLYYDDTGRRHLRFNAKDGLGLAMLCRTDVCVAILSGRPVDIARARHEELGVDRLIGNARDKRTALLELCEELKVSPERTAYVGDDLPDLGAFAACGLRIAVADAAREVRQSADWVTRASGGHGAAREVCEAILKARGDWDRWLEKLRSRDTRADRPDKKSAPSSPPPP